MQRIFEDLPGGALLHLGAGVEHDYPVGDLGYNAQVMGDEQDTGFHILLEPVQKQQYLLLDGHIQGGGRLIGNEQAGLEGHHHGDHDALAQAAGELEGELLHAFLCIGNAHLFR